jgi:hypothetical protein
MPHHCRTCTQDFETKLLEAEAKQQQQQQRPPPPPQMQPSPQGQDQQQQQQQEQQEGEAGEEGQAGGMMEQQQELTQEMLEEVRGVCVCVCVCVCVARGVCGWDQQTLDTAAAASA